ncbi:hypothetical protein ISCGN_029425 [Ixodes scapularis]
MDAFQRHGGLLIYEMKLSENLKVTSSGFIEGFVDLGAYTSVDQSTETCDHGLVVLFQPFSGDFQQILGVFGSHSNVKAGVLAKIIVDATIAAEKSGLFVDFVTTDGASWNKSMWQGFGVKGTAEKSLQSGAPRRRQKKSPFLVRFSASCKVRSQLHCVDRPSGT